MFSRFGAAQMGQSGPRVPNSEGAYDPSTGLVLRLSPRASTELSAFREPHDSEDAHEPTLESQRGNSKFRGYMARHSDQTAQVKSKLDRASACERLK